MKAMKIIGLLCVLIVSVVLTQNASALPAGSMTDWEGNRTYDEVYVEWAVYDIADNPWDAEVTFPAGSEYIYAYQIANLGADPISSFTLLESFGGQDIDWSSRVSGTTALDDDLHTEDVLPVLPCEYEAVWNWSPVEGDGFIMADGYSAFLIYASPYAPVAGGFKVERSTDEGEPPVPEVPEPATIALFGIASSWLITNHRKKRQAA